jgi:probable F420-dependent oxidoreductase
VKVDTGLALLETAANRAVIAEAGGYDGIFTGEVNNDPFLPLALAAEATERIDLGTSIAVAFARSPMTLAYTAWDLQRLSQGRMVVGLGSQVKAHITRRFSMPWGKPVGQMREFVLAMRSAWNTWSTGEPLQVDGEHYQHTLMPPTFVPSSHEYGVPKVLIAGVGDAMTTMAGEVADGFLCHGFTTEQWMRTHTIPALQVGLDRAGKGWDGFTVKAATFLATGSDEEMERSIKNIRGHVAFYASTPSYKPVLDLHGWGEIGTELTHLSKTGRWDEMSGLVTDEMLHAFAIVAPVEQVPALLAERYAGRLDRVSFISATPSPELLEALH